MFLEKKFLIKIEKKLYFDEKAMKQKWSDIAFSTTNYRDTNIKILGSVESIESILGKIINNYIHHLRTYVCDIYLSNKRCFLDLIGLHGDIMGFFK